MKTSEIVAALKQDGATAFALRLSGSPWDKAVRRVFLLERGWAWDSGNGPPWTPVREPRHPAWAAMVERDGKWERAIVSARDIEPLHEVQAIADVRAANDEAMVSFRRRVATATKSLLAFAPSASAVGGAVRIAVEDAEAIVDALTSKAVR